MAQEQDRAHPPYSLLWLPMGSTPSPCWLLLPAPSRDLPVCVSAPFPSLPDVFIFLEEFCVVPDFGDMAVAAQLPAHLSFSKMSSEE